MFFNLKNSPKKAQGNKSEILTVALIGAGLRGMMYTSEMKGYPDRFRVVAVAEPDEGRRSKIQKTHWPRDGLGSKMADSSSNSRIS